MRGEAAAMASTFLTPSAVSRMAWMRIGLLDGVLGLELGQQLVEVVDVPGALDLRQHDHVELVAGGGDDLDDVVEHPGQLRQLMRVHRPVGPKSLSRAMAMKPARAASF